MRYRAIVCKVWGNERCLRSHVVAVFESEELKDFSAIVGTWLTTMADDWEIVLSKTAKEEKDA